MPATRMYSAAGILLYSAYLFWIFKHRDGYLASTTLTASLQIWRLVFHVRMILLAIFKTCIFICCFIEYNPKL